MSKTQTRDDVRLNLLHILPAGTRIQAIAYGGRRTSGGQTRTSVVFLSPAGHNISEAVAIVLQDTFRPATPAFPQDAVRGFYGGNSPALQAVSELSRALHGSSTALSLSATSALRPASPVQAAPAFSTARARARR